jgi:hypothetical protein
MEIQMKESYTNLRAPGGGATLPPHGDSRRIYRQAAFALLVTAMALLCSANAFAQKVSLSGAHDWNVAGSWSPSGVPASTDDVTISAGSTITLPNPSGPHTWNCNNITIAATGTLVNIITAGNISFYVYGSWLNNGTYTHNGHTTHFQPLVPSTLTPNGTGSGKDFGAVSFEGPSSMTLAGDIVIQKSFDINGGGTWDVTGSNYSISVGGSWTFAGVGTTFLQHTGTVHLFSGDVATISAFGMHFYNLIMEKTSIAQLQTGIIIDNNFTLSSGTFDVGSPPGSNQMNIGHYWYYNGGTFNPQHGAVVFDGSLPMYITGNKETDFYDLEISSPNTMSVVLDYNCVVYDHLFLTQGRIQTGSNHLQMGYKLQPLSNSAITYPASGFTSYVYGYFDWVYSTGSTSRFFPIGDANREADVEVELTSVTSTGSLRASTTFGDRINLAASGIAPNMSVNRVWTVTAPTDTVITFTSTNNNVTMHWDPTLDVDAGFLPLSAYTAKFDTPNWSNFGPASNPFTDHCTMANVAGFSDFQVGDEACPTTPTGSDEVMCYGSTVPVLSVTLGNPTDEKADWYAGPSGGSPIYSNSTTYQPSPAPGITTTYYVEVTNTISNCVLSPRKPIILTVTQVTASITAGPNPVVCFGDGQGSVTVTGANGAPAYTYSKDAVNYQSSGTFTGLTAGDYSNTV